MRHKAGEPSRSSLHDADTSLTSRRAGELFQAAFDQCVRAQSNIGSPSIFDTALSTDRPMVGWPWAMKGKRPLPAVEWILRSYAQRASGQVAKRGESRSFFKRRLIMTFGQMMYVSGETAEPSIETTSIIEDIVRQQVIEIVRFSPDTEAPTSPSNARRL